MAQMWLLAALLPVAGHFLIRAHWWIMSWFALCLVLLIINFIAVMAVDDGIGKGIILFFALMPVGFATVVSAVFANFLVPEEGLVHLTYARAAMAVVLVIALILTGLNFRASL